MAMRLKRHVSLFESSLRRAIVPSVANSLCIRCRRYASSAAYPKNIAVLGGGISGLSSAYFVAQEFPNSKITIYEGGKNPGGWIQSKRVSVPGGDVLFECGPRTLRPGGDSYVTQKLVEELGLVGDTLKTERTAPGAKNRYIYYPDRLQLMPGPGAEASFLGLLSSGIFAGFHKALIEPWVAPRDKHLKDESVGSFLTRRLDKRPAQRLVSAIFHGIYAGDVWKLSARSLLPLPWQMEKYGTGVVDGWIQLQKYRKPGTWNFLSHPYRVQVLEAVKKELKVDKMTKWLEGASVFTFKDGMQQLTNALSDNLTKNPNVNFKLGTVVDTYKMAPDGQQQVQVVAEDQSTSNYDLVVSTLRDPKLTPYVTVMTVNLYYQKQNLNPVKGFGYLIPQAVPFKQNPERALGVTFDSDAIQGQDNSPPGTKLTVMLGGHWWDGWEAYPDVEEGIALARSVVQRHLGITEEPTRSNVGLWQDCIPQYTVGYEDRLRAHSDDVAQRFKGMVRLVGNQYNGVAVNNCIEHAWMMARGLRGNGWKERKTGLEERLTEQPWVVRQKQMEE